jgi:Uma2 family endonuclease
MVVQTSPEIIYPDCDGHPMSDNTKQFRWIVTVKENLDLLFADNPDVFVAGDLLWYPVEGSNTIRSAPDAMIVFGRPKGDRGSYQQWREDDIPPQVVFEILSPGNRLGEMNKKFKFYERYGVEEYYIYDPDKVDFTGWLRQEGQLEPIEEIQGWTSPRLGIKFELDQTTLIIYRPDGDRFLEFGELDARRQVAEQRAERAELETTVAKQDAEIARQDAESARQDAESARQDAAKLAAKLRELGIDPDRV